MFVRAKVVITITFTVYAHPSLNKNIWHITIGRVASAQFGFRLESRWTPLKCRFIATKHVSV